MILNAYAVLAIFVGLVELALGIAVVVVAASALRRRRAWTGALPALETVESSASLLTLLAFALVGASVASWPLLYLLLASYVPEWIGVMCVEGVRRVGTGSEGAAGWLPALVRTLEVTKPALVFAAGAWVVLHLADRRTRTSPLAGRALGMLLAVGVLATLDAGTQLTYVGIPKQERFLAMGCCTVPQDLADRAASLGLAVIAPGGGTPSRTPPIAAFYALTGALVIGTRWAAIAARTRGAGSTQAPRTGWTSDALTVAALASLPVAVWFLADVAAPALLARPDHRCAYCLLTTSPIAVAAIASYAVGTFATGWAGVAHRFARVGETAAALPAQRRALLRTASIAFLASLVLLTGRLVFA